MPRDDWAKAKAKDAAKKRTRAAWAKKQRHGKRHLRKTNAWNPNSCLWFGKHKDKPLVMIPYDYLVWLASLPNSQHQPMYELQRYLRIWLATRPRVS